MPFVECEIRVKRERFSLIEPGLGVLEGKEFPLPAPLAVKRSHQVWLNTLARVQIDFDSL